MTDRLPDTEKAIHDWLSDETPASVPASIRMTLEVATSQPQAPQRRWSGLGGMSLRPAGRIAAAAAIVAIVAAGAYLYPIGRTSTPATGTASPSARPTAIDSVARPTGSAASNLPSGWRLVTGVFPRMVAPAFSLFQPTVFQLPGGGGFIAFVPSTDGVASGGSAQIVLTAFVTAGPTSPASWTTHVFSSIDGLTWKEQAPLPSDAASVRDVTYSSGIVVAVGWTGEAPNSTAMAWTIVGLGPWRAIKLPAQGATFSDAYNVAGGPGGFLAFGTTGSSSRFWTSPDGIKWNVLEASGLPAEPSVDALYGNGAGWEITGNLPDRSATWQSSRDGSVWTQTWTGPAGGSATSGLEGYYLGRPIGPANGDYVSFGSAYRGTGGPAALPSDTLVWTSVDGLRWTQSARVPSPGWIQGFAPMYKGYVGAGQLVVGDGGLQEYGPLGVWTTVDGRSWTALPGIASIRSVQVLSVVGGPYQAVVAFTDEKGNLQLLVSGV